MAKGQPIVRLTAETNDYERKIKQANKTFDGFLKGIGMSPSKFSALTVAIGATTTAMKVASDAFKASEATMDQWNGYIRASEATYEGFLNALNTGDISGFLSRINTIVAAAREAYNELDRLQTMQAIDSPRLTAQRVENERMRAMLRSGRHIDAMDGRKSSIPNGALLTDEQQKILAKQLENGIRREYEIVEGQVKQYTRTINALYRDQSARLGMSMKEFQAGTASMNALDERIAGYNRYIAFEQQHTNHVTMNSSAGAITQSVRDSAVNPYAKYKSWGIFQDGGPLFTEIVNLIKQRGSVQSQQISTMSSMYRQINKAQGITGGGGGGRRGGRGGGGGGGGGRTTVEKTETQLNNEMIDMLAKQYEAASEEHRKEIREQISELQKRNKEIQRYYDIAIGAEKIYTKQDVDLKGAGVADFAKVDFAKMATQPADKIVSPYEALQMQLTQLEEAQKKAWSPEAFANYEAAIEEIKKKIAAFTGVNLPKAGKDAANAWRDAASAIGQVGSALSSISNPAARIAGIIGEAIAKIALAFADASLQEGKKGIWAWVAASAVGLTTMISTISAIKSATAGNYAEGGIIPGNSYSGDNMRVYGLNAGEIVLNRAQAGNLASQLSGAGANMRLEAVVSGEQLRLVMNGNSRRTGRGEILTTKFR